MSSVVLDGNRRIRNTQRREEISTGEFTRRKISTGAETQFKGDCATTEGFVDHGRIVETGEEKKRSFQRESQLKEE